MSCVVILGMHRTGTSMVGGVLHRLGVFMGRQLQPPDRANPLGYYEDLTFRGALNELLSRAGGSWAFPPRPERLARLDLTPYEPFLSHEFAWREARYTWWGLKDPRLVLLIPKFYPLLPDPHIIRTGRSVLAVAASLARRDGLSFRHACSLYDRYTGDIKAFLEGKARLSIRYETALGDRRRTVQRIVDFLGLHPSEAQFEEAVRFINPELNHYTEEMMP